MPKPLKRTTATCVAVNSVELHSMTRLNCVTVIWLNWKHGRIQN